MSAGSPHPPDWNALVSGAVDLFDEGVIVIAADGSITAANAKAAPLLGLTHDQLTGRSALDPAWGTIDAAGAPLPGGRLPGPEAIRTGEPQRDNIVGVRLPDGTLRWQSVTAVPLRLAPGESPYAALVRYTDITPRHQEFRALADAAQRLEEVEAIAQLGTWEYDVVSDQLQLSEGLFRLVGHTPATLPQGQAGFEATVHPQDRDEVFVALQETVRHGRDFNVVHRIRRADGSIATVRVRARAQLDGEGNVLRVVGATQDISEPARMERELSSARDKLRGVLDAVTEHAIVATNPFGVITEINRGAELMFGYAADEVIGGSPGIWHDAEEIIARAAELGIPPSLDVFTYSARQGVPETRDWTYVRKDGERRRMAITLTVQRDPKGAVLGYISVARDVTEVHRAEIARRQAEARFRTAFDHAPIGVGLVDLADESPGLLLEANRALGLLVGRDEQELHGMRLPALVHPEDADSLTVQLAALARSRLPSFQSEVRLMHRDGQFVWALLGAAADLREGEQTAVLQVLDITERKRFEGQLQYLADHDPLTGLYNRRRFEEELERALAHSGRYQVPGALMMIDLDGLKLVNDTLGHAAGDELIERVARLLRHSLRTSDVVARLGGDEFGILLPQMSQEAAEQVADKLLDALREGGIVLTANHHGRVTASIGITAWEGPAASEPHELLIQADRAMYTAKDSGRDRYAVHEPDAGGDAPDGTTWLERLREALGVEDGFVLHAQPIVPIAAANDGIDRYELLVRMRGDGSELVPPGTFLALAERYDLVQQLDRWVLAQAVALVRTRELANHPVNVTVNLSGRTVNDPALARDLELLLRDGPLREGALTVEVTETEAIVNIDRARILARDLRALGCRFALDDFGAGFASFYYLKHLAFDLLKIDGEFIRQLPITPTDRLVVRAVVDIARAMGTETCAEFVGDDETVEILREMGVDYGQGFHLGRPRPVEALLAEAG
ncbi:MAG: EAL domain-containing protein [Solirubrobacteraceae bacterium]|nr:EAL domain-containing protein [Solirubrobacteraceae bacterium]